MGSADRSRVAIVIVTRDRCATLLKSLDQLAALREGHRVVVVDNGSTHGTRRAVSSRHPEPLLLTHRDRTTQDGAAGRPETGSGWPGFGAPCPTPYDTRAG